MDPSLMWIISIIILITLSAFFSSTETAFSSLSKARLKNYASSGDKRAKKALKIAEQYDTALSAILIGNNIVNIGAASIGTLLFSMWLGEDLGAGVSTVVLTVVVLIFGEVMPKNMAKLHPEDVAMKSSAILFVLMKVFFPLIWCLRQIIKLFAKKSDGVVQPSVTEEELKVIIEEIEDEGVLNEHESELVQSAIDFDYITVDEILTPRVDVAAVEINDSSEKIINLFFSTGYSRIPVFDKTIDNIVGLINEKDFIKAFMSHEEVQIKSILQKVIYIPPKKRISQLLKELQKNRLHMAVVTDPFGGTIGIITLEDIIEELVGEIWDESDKVTNEMESLSDDMWRISGDMNVYDLFEKLKIDDTNYDGSSQSISGWALDSFERIPEQGEAFDFENLHIIVETIAEQRITSFLVKVNSAFVSDEN